MKRQSSKKAWLILLLGCVLLNAACGVNSAEPPPLQSKVDSSNALVAAAEVPTSTAIPATATAVLLTIAPTATPSPVPFVQQTVLGTSTGGHPIDAWTFGHGNRRLVLIGGIHGGYEWNTVLLSYKLIDYFEQNPDALPANMQLIVIPTANPDGLEKVVGKVGRFDLADVPAERISAGRFNNNGVDLNRNWDCRWQAEANWSIHTVSGGTAPFSEVEAAILRDYLAKVSPRLVIFYHSVADGVYTGQCDGESLDATVELSKAYAERANYTHNSAFSAYAITGDATDYLNRVGTAAFTIELTSATSLEWEQNLAGVQLMIRRISEATDR